MQTIRRASVVLVIALGLVLGGPMSPAFAFAPAAASADATWARSAALPSGAIAVYVDRQRVLPYLGNFAAWGLAVRAGGPATSFRFARPGHIWPGTPPRRTRRGSSRTTWSIRAAH